MAESDLEREGAIRWFDETLGSRLDDKKTGRVAVIEQRTHQADLSGHLLAQDGWEHLCLPAEFERRTTIVMPRSGREVVRQEGQLLWPEREGRAELAADVAAGIRREKTTLQIDEQGSLIYEPGGKLNHSRASSPLFRSLLGTYSHGHEPANS